MKAKFEKWKSEFFANDGTEESFGSAVVAGIGTVLLAMTTFFIITMFAMMHTPK